MPDRLTRVKRAIAAGHSPSRIAKSLGISRSAMSHYFRRNDLTPARKKSRVPQICKLAADGMPAAGIAERVGCTAAYVYQTCREHKQPIVIVPSGRRKKYTVEQEATIIKMLGPIAKAVGKTKTEVASHIANLNKYGRI